MDINSTDEDYEVNISPVVSKTIFENSKKIEKKIELLDNRIQNMENIMVKILDSLNNIQNTSNNTREFIIKNREIYGKEFENIKQTEEKTRKDIAPILDSIYNKEDMFTESRIYNRFWRSSISSNNSGKIGLLGKPFTKNA